MAGTDGVVGMVVWLVLVVRAVCGEGGVGGMVDAGWIDWCG